MFVTGGITLGEKWSKLNRLSRNKENFNISGKNLKFEKIQNIILKRQWAGTGFPESSETIL